MLTLLEHKIKVQKEKVQFNTEQKSSEDCTRGMLSTNETLKESYQAAKEGVDQVWKPKFINEDGIEEEEDPNDNMKLRTDVVNKQSKSDSKMNLNDVIGQIKNAADGLKIMKDKNVFVLIGGTEGVL